ncbi:MAG TPA: OB-fold nucleic acid binding domain-containing protein, partial [Candidatus Thermoplasmatota archaeon]
MLERIVASLTDRGCLLDPQAAQYITQQPQPELYLETALGRMHELPFVITVDTLRTALDNPLLTPPAPAAHVLRPQPMLTVNELFSPSLADVMPQPASQLVIPQTLSGAMRRALAAEHPAEVRVLKDSSTTPRGSGDVKDFVRYFQDRLEQMTRLLKQRREVANAVRIKDVARAGRDIQLIGLVKEKSKRPSGHRFLTLEDSTGEVDVLFPIDKPELGSQFDTLLSDEVVGVVGHPTKDG